MKKDQEPAFSAELGPKRYSAYADAEKPQPPPPPLRPGDPVHRGSGGDAGAGLQRSLALHGIFLVLFFGVPYVQKILGLESESSARLRAMEAARTAIRVDIVDLPRLKLTEMQNVDLSQDVNKDILTPKEEEKTSEPSATAMVDKTKPKDATKTPVKESPLAKKDPKADRIKELQERLRADQKRRDAIAKLQGAGKSAEKGGRPEIAGNMVSEGYAATGSVASAADAYNGKAKAHLQRNWRVPGWITAGTLKASIIVKIAPNGRVLYKQFNKKSGNSEFDESVLRAVDAADPFPPPPENLKLSYMEDGVVFGFPE